MPAPTDQEILALAKEYPYAIPADSFVVADGVVRSLDHAPSPGELASRHSVLAYGSNAAPDALARKAAAPDFPRGEPLVLLAAVLHDHDVVFSAHLSPYGAVPATLQVSPGARASVFVMLATAAQLAAIERTEPNYELVRMEDPRIEIESQAINPGPFAFLSRHGCLDVEGAEVALEAVPVAGRSLRAMGEPQALRQVASRFGEERDVDRFIVETARDPALAARRTEVLRGLGHPFRGRASPAAGPSVRSGGSAMSRGTGERSTPGW